MITFIRMTKENLPAVFAAAAEEVTGHKAECLVMGNETFVIICNCNYNDTMASEIFECTPAVKIEFKNGYVMRTE